MSGIVILGTGSYTPPDKITNEMLAEIIDSDSEWVLSRTGIAERAVAAPEMRTLDLARNAATAAMENAGISADEIAVVIVATITNDYITPSISCLLQRELGLPEGIIPMDINCACGGFVYAMKVAHALLADFPQKSALILGCDMLSRITDYTDRATCILFGDGAGAAIVRRGERGKFAFDSGARGDSEMIFCRAKYLCNNPIVRRPEAETFAAGISMNGGEVLRFAERTASASVLRVLEKAGLTVENVDCFVFHQANKRILDGITKRLGIPPERCATNIETHGNTSAAASAILLDELTRSGKIKNDSKIVISAFGAGMTFASVCIDNSKLQV